MLLDRQQLVTLDSQQTALVQVDRFSRAVHETLDPVATAFVEKGAAAMGLERRECLALTLATEEIFACICRQGQPGQPLGIDLVNGGYFEQGLDTILEGRRFIGNGKKGIGSQIGRDLFYVDP